MGVPNRQSTFSDAVRNAIDYALTDLHTCLPGTIESFDATTQTAKINLAIRRIKHDLTADGQQDRFDITPLTNVPVVFPSSGGYSITFPVAAGDEVLVVFSERSIDTWQQSGGTQDPLDRRKHEYTDAIAIIGLHSNPKKIANYSTDAMAIRSDDGNTEITVADDSVNVDVGLTNVSIDALTVDIDIAGTGGATYNADGSVDFKNGARITNLADGGDFITATGISVNRHKHTDPGPSPVGNN